MEILYHAKALTRVLTYHTTACGVCQSGYGAFLATKNRL